MKEAFHRRRFLQTTAAGVAMLHPLSRLALAQRRRKLPARVSALLSTPQPAFPTVTPIFAAAFVPGGSEDDSGQPQLVRSETFDDFTAQVQSQSASGYVLSCFSTIQSMNRTWFYGVFEPGSGAYILMRTPDPNAFQQAFAQQQGGYTLVDFNIAWELGQLYYSGYWLASSNPKHQSLLWGLDFKAFNDQWNTVSANGMRMTRLQAFPQREVAAYSALFEAAAGDYSFYYGPLAGFASDVTKYGGQTLVGLGYNPVDGTMNGAWRAKLNPSQFVYNQDWDTLTATVQQAASNGMVVQALAAYPNAPSFDDYLETNLGPFTMGYAYAVAKDGQIIANGGGYARGPQQAVNPKLPFTGDTRLNLASVSKAVTGIILTALLQKTGISLDAPFWPLVQAMIPDPDPSVKVVTLRNLATMKSGMTQEPAEGPISPPDGTDFWGYLKSYLSKPLVGTPGVTYYYDNTNFSILQGVIGQVSGTSYLQFTTDYVLKPAGIDPSILSPVPDPSTTAALSYSGPNDTRPGYYWGELGFIGPAGWICSARELVKLLAALRGTSILPSSAVSEMFNDGLGWYTNVGNFGTYYQHNGGIGNGLTPPQNVNTVVFHFSEGYDMALLSNHDPPVDVTTIAQNAFDSRGLPASALPTNAPAIVSVVHAASLLPKAAPGGYVSILGSSFTSQSLDWTQSTGGGALPVEVEGIRVRVGSQFAYVQYVSPTQVNILLPSNIPPGNANVELTTPDGGMTATLEIDAIAPGLYAYRLNGTLYAAALFAGTEETYVAAANALPGYTSRPAVAGDVVELFGTGMGPTKPVAPDGLMFEASYPAADLSEFKATIGGQSATLLYAGLIAPGLYVVDVRIPAGLKSGDQLLALTVSGVPIQPNLMLTIGA